MAASPAQTLRLAYGFARQYGICLRPDAQGQPIAVYLNGLQPAILSEVRRFRRRAVALPRNKQ